METARKSMAETENTVANALRAGLIRNGHGSLRAWAAKRRVNYNTAWAAMNGRRAGAVARRVLRLLRKDSHAA